MKIYTVLVAMVFIHPALANAGMWSSHGPEGGDISALAVDPTTPSTVYAASGAGQLYKTTDGGGHWSVANNGLGIKRFYALTVDPTNGETVYAETLDDGIFKTDDGGGSWSLFYAGGHGIAVDPLNSQTIYVSSNGIYKTLDGGSSWTPLSNSPTTSGRIVVDPVTPSTVYALSGGVFQSLDGGTTWTAINNGLDTSGSFGFVIALSIDPSSPTTLYAGTGSGKIFKTTDAGANWALVESGLPFVYALVIDPLNANNVYAGVSGPGGGGVYKTSDGGSNWALVNTGLIDPNTAALVIDPTDPSILYASSGNAGVFKTTDGAASWAAINTGLTGTWVLSLAVDPGAASTAYAGTQYHGVFKTIDAGLTWTAINSGLPNLDVGVDALAIDPDDAATVFAGTGSGIFKTADGGSSWSPSLTGATVLSLAIDPTNPLIVYAGLNFGGGGVTTTDGGITWTGLLSNGLSGHSVQGLAVDPVTSGIVYAATTSGGVFKTTDGGASWAAINNGIPSYVLALAADPVNAGTVYAATSGGIFKTTNGGASWTLANSGIVPGAGPGRGELIVDPANPSVVYAGTQGAGVFVTTNGGTSWTALNDGLTSLQIYSLAVGGTGTARLYAGTLGGAAFVYQSTCGNGVVEAGEQCDDGNTVDGDGCSSTCQPVPPPPGCGNGVVEPGEQCDDGNVLDGDGCSSTCQDSATPESETNPSLGTGQTITTDTENDGATAADPTETALTMSVGTAAVTISESSGQAPPVPGYSLLDQQVQITFDCPIGPCPSASEPLTLDFRIDASRIPTGVDENTLVLFRDGILVPSCSGAPGIASPDPCVRTRQRFSDGDVGLTALTSRASVWTFASQACSTVPIACTDPGGAIFKVKKKTGDPSATKLLWKWLHGTISPVSVLGDPLGSTSYTMCVYDGTSVVESHVVAPGGDCGGAPCWKALGTKGFEYKNSVGNADGITKLLLKSGLGKAKILMQGKGAQVAVPASNPIYTPGSALTVQLLTSSGNCWQAVYPSPADVSTGERFLDKIP